MQNPANTKILIIAKSLNNRIVISTVKYLTSVQSIETVTSPTLTFFRDDGLSSLLTSSTLAVVNASTNPQNYHTSTLTFFRGDELLGLSTSSNLTELMVITSTIWKTLIKYFDYNLLSVLGSQPTVL